MNMKDYPTLHIQKELNVREQLVAKKDMDVNKHERLSNFTHIDIT